MTKGAQLNGLLVDGKGDTPKGNIIFVYPKASATACALLPHVMAHQPHRVQWQCLQSCRVLVHATSISDGGDVDATGSLITLDCGQHGCVRCPTSAQV